MTTRRRFLIASAGGLAAAALGCHRDGPPAAVVPGKPTSDTIVDPAVAAAAAKLTQQSMRFTDISGPAGIKWTFNSGGNVGRLVVDQIGGGVALFDYNGDGLLDIFAVQGGPLPEASRAGRTLRDAHAPGGGRSAANFRFLYIQHNTLLPSIRRLPLLIDGLEIARLWQSYLIFY